ncbi:hypothetical protein ACPYO6_09375 [Georgenia sp. Z1344]|uniref:hypothetical protein n=1 Tax=Georgenia sp. Z1344 TaxID=3416706 RepID=UPI003CF1CA78
MRTAADPAVIGLVEACLTWAFRSAGVTVAVVPGEPAPGDHPTVRVAVSGPRLTEPFSYDRELVGMSHGTASCAAATIFEDVQNYLDEGELYGLPVPPCGAHPRHPANLDPHGTTVRLRCSADAADWFEDFPGLLDVSVVAGA